MRLTRILLTTLLLIVAARLLLLFATYVLGFAGVQRHHIEATGVVFVVLAIVLRYAIGTSAKIEAGRVMAAQRVMWPGLCVLAIVLYWPALFVGLLSDDHVLVQRAAALDISPVSSTLFRPMPLLAWALILQLGGGPFLLHLLNVVLHGTNAYLSALVIGEWVPDRRWVVLSGLLVLCAPLAPEAVAWCSGIFDVSAAAFVLGAMVIAKRYRLPRPSALARVAFILVSLGAVLCKETAAIGPLLVLLVAWVNGRASKALLIDSAIVVVAIGLYAGLRLAAHPEPSLFAVTKYSVQRAVFSAFGSLAVPYHVDVRTAALWLPIVCVVLSVTLWTRFSTTAGPRRQLALAVAGMAWVLIAILPAWSILVVAGDLQASRFLYLAAAGWSAVMIVSATAAAREDRMTIAATLAVATLVALNGAAARMHLQPWQQAGQLRDRVLHAAAANERLRSCSDVAIADAPDNVRGAYVFRNGLAEAFSSRLGITVVGSPSNARCAFRWTAGETFVAVAARE